VSALDDLQRQLLDSVARRHAGAVVRPSRRWRASGRRAVHRRWLTLVAIPLVFAAAAAAAKIVTQTDESPANALSNRVLGETGSSAACRMTGPRKSRLSSEAPDPSIAATLPALARPPHDPPPASVVALAERNSGGAVLARTIRVVRLPDGIRLIEYVAHGEGPFTLVDPRRCEAARLALLAQLRPREHDPLRETVARQITQMPETNPGTQSLTLTRLEQRPGQPIDGGGASFPVLPAQASLQTGVLFSGSGCENARPAHPAYCTPIFYGGIVKPATAYLTLQPAPGTPATGVGGRIRRRIGVSEGLFAFTVPRDTGPELVVQRARDGRPLAVSSLSFDSGPRRRAGQEEAAGRSARG